MVKFLGTWVRLFCVSIVLTLLLAGSFVYAIEFGGTGARPVFPREDNDRTQDIFVHTLEAGSFQEEGVRVINNTEEKKTLFVYGTDSLVSSGGAFACRQLAEPKNEVGAWMELETLEVTLEPMTSSVVLFTLDVPDDVEVGEYDGCIAVQEKVINSKSGMSLSTRTALRVVVTVPGDILRSLQVVDFEVKDGVSRGKILFPQVMNMGNVSIDANIFIETYDLFGRFIQRHGGEYSILRGESMEWNFDIAAPFFGSWYESVLSIEYDENSAAEIGMNTDTPLVIIKSEPIQYFIGPSFIGLIVECLLGVTLFFFFVLSFLAIKQRQWVKKTWVVYSVKAGDNVEVLAKKHGISWKFIVKVNKLVLPYSLKKGEKLKLPSVRKSGLKKTKRIYKKLSKKSVKKSSKSSKKSSKK